MDDQGDDDQEFSLRMFVSNYRIFDKHKSQADMTPFRFSREDCTMDKDKVIQTLQENRSTLTQFQVCSLSVFGSIAQGKAGPDSDIDILVDFEPGAHVGLFALARLQRFLQNILGRKVDLTTPKALHKALKKDILKEAVHAF